MMKLPLTITPIHWINWFRKHLRILSFQNFQFRLCQTTQTTMLNIHIIMAPMRSTMCKVKRQFVLTHTCHVSRHTCHVSSHISSMIYLQITKLIKSYHTEIQVLITLSTPHKLFQIDNFIPRTVSIRLHHSISTIIHIITGRRYLQSTLL